MLCVIANCSPEADQKLSALREAAFPPGRFTSPLNAHITLATYLPEDYSAFMEACEKLLRRCHPFTVRYKKLEVLSETSIIVATPSISDELAVLHQSIVKEFSLSLDRWTCGSSWYPHTTLVYDPAADLQQICGKMQARFIPFEDRICQFQFSKVEGSGYTIIKTIHLREEE
jgi:2'-5' RNA ligase